MLWTPAASGAMVMLPFAGIGHSGPPSTVMANLPLKPGQLIT
jgi:hypothetical protein